jgi:hypothetical protein
MEIVGVLNKQTQLASGLYYTNSTNPLKELASRSSLFSFVLNARSLNNFDPALSLRVLSFRFSVSRVLFILRA